MKLLQNEWSLPWLKIWLLAPLLWGTAISTNETLLRIAQAEPSVVSDADLFCTVYKKVDELSKNDIIFLGASRMQTGIDLSVVKKRSHAQEALMLAQSGRGTAYPVFQSVVEDTNYNGTIVIDETEQTLASKEREQQQFVDSCEQFSFDSWLNRQISTALQSHFTFINPQSSSFRLWGNLLVDRELPEPFYTKTLPDRQQIVDYERADPVALQALVEDRLKGAEVTAEEPLSITDWLAKTEHWEPLIQKFQQRGGVVIFVRMPVSQKRWSLEEKSYPPDRYWDAFIRQNDVISVHFNHSPMLSRFELADTSHLGFQSKEKFTQALFDIFEEPYRLSSKKLNSEVHSTP